MRLVFLLFFWLGIANTAHAFELELAQCTSPVTCAKRSVVSLLPDWPPDFTRNEEPEGSGVVLGNGTLIATADHVLGPARSARIRTHAGRIIAAEIVLRDSPSDIALLKLKVPLKPFPVVQEASLTGRVCAIGNSFGLDLSVTCGVASGTQVTGTGFNQIEDFLQTDAAVNPGMSGGALINEQGELVGMLSAIFTRQSDANVGVNFAVSGALLLHVLRQFENRGEVVHRVPGVVTRASDPEKAGGYIGAEVLRIKETSPEALAGLQVGDIILKAGARRIKRAGAYETAVALAPENSELELVVWRQDKQVQLTLILDTGN